ncbi:MAG: hypothetical protein IJF54_02050 [Clostridia bacterium]|nr:hypothetical protein [Clostridia bacterium]
MKSSIYKIYRATAKLNLYVSRCEIDKKRVLYELNDIKSKIETTIKIIEDEKQARV